MTEQLSHAGVKGMKKGFRGINSAISSVAAKYRNIRSRRRGVSQETDEVTNRIGSKSEREFETDHIVAYRNRDKMSTRQIQNRIQRLRAEQELEDLVYKKERARKNAELKRAAEEKERKLQNKKRLVRVTSSVLNSLPASEIAVRTVNRDAYDNDNDYKTVVKQREEVVKTLQTVSRLMNAAVNPSDGGGKKK